MNKSVGTKLWIYVLSLIIPKKDKQKNNDERSN